MVAFHLSCACAGVVASGRSRAVRLTAAPTTCVAAAGTSSNRRNALFALAAPAVAQVIALPVWAAPAKGPLPGDAAPAFTLTSNKGGDVSLSSLIKKGGFTVLYFYNADGSPGCSLEAERFQQALPAFEKAHAEVVGISMDSLEKHDEFCKAKALTFPLLSDNTGIVSAAYGADLKIPLFGSFSDRQTFLIDRAGVVRQRWLESDGSMADVRTPAHTKQILAAIAAL